jgi:hypothetical protein
MEIQMRVILLLLLSPIASALGDNHFNYPANSDNPSTNNTWNPSQFPVWQLGEEQQILWTTNGSFVSLVLLQEGQNDTEMVLDRTIRGPCLAL